MIVQPSTCRTIDDGRCVALAFRVLSSNLKFAAIIVDGGAVGALIALTRSTDTACRLRYELSHVLMMFQLVFRMLLLL